MKRYLQLEQNYSWKDLISKIEPEVHCLLLKDDKNFCLGWGTKDVIQSSSENCLLELDTFFRKNKGEYIMGYLNYDLKNQIEPSLNSSNPVYQESELVSFFVPEHLILNIEGCIFYYGKSETDEIVDLIGETEVKNTAQEPIELRPSTSKEEYLNAIQKILEYIQRGDIYETNYCINFSAADVDIDQNLVFQNLVSNTNAPFSSLYSDQKLSILSASPERFINRTKDRLSSEPIKGTAKRSSNLDEDKELKDNLKNDPKERSENIMIVDLVRNDLSKLAIKNSVSVDELCEIRSFKSVHQMVSKVSCRITPSTSMIDVVKALFPMGSMTGAPKYRAMEIADELESFQRGIYSGAIGMITPNGNCDFNVVIRSLLYSKKDRHLSASVGGAITIRSTPEQEYQECLLKLEALKNSLC